MIEIKFRSTYGLSKDASFRGESFRHMPLTWRLGVCSIDILKIRIASWTPKLSRKNSAVFYYDVDTVEKANEILNRYEVFNFKRIESYFEKEYLQDNILGKNTGETMDWLTNTFLPKARSKFASPIETPINK